MILSRYLTLALTTAVALSTSCKKDEEKKKESPRHQGQITNLTEPFSVTLKGASLTVVPGALLLNSVIKLDEVPTPVTLSSVGATRGEAAKAYSISATRDSLGLAVATLPVALTMPIGKSLSAAGTDSLCVVAVPTAAPAKVFVWKRSELIVDAATVKVETRYFGIYQVSSCATTTLSNTVEQTRLRPLYTAAQGTWTKQCVEGRSYRATRDYVSKVVTISNYDVTHETTHFKDSTCAPAGQTYTVRINATIDTQGPATTPAGAQQARWLMTSVTLNPSAETAIALNGQAVCGVTNWAANAPKELLNNTRCPVGLAFEDSHWYYDLLMVDQTGLRFGASLAPTEAARPTSLGSVTLTR